MKKFCMTIVSVCLIACSSEVGPIETSPPTDPLRGLRGGSTASLSDGGSDPIEVGDGGSAGQEDPDAGAAGSAAVDPQDASDGAAGSRVPSDDAGQDSGAQTLQRVRELFVGTWSGQSLSAGHPCGDEITAETVSPASCYIPNDPVSSISLCGTQTVTIDTDYSIESDQGVAFTHWDEAVWVGGYDNDFMDDHRLLRLWLIDADTMLGERMTKDSPVIGTVCVPWKLTRQ